MRVLLTISLSALIVVFGVIGIWTTEYTQTEKLVISVSSFLSVAFYILAEVLDVK